MEGYGLIEVKVTSWKWKHLYIERNSVGAYGESKIVERETLMYTCTTIQMNIRIKKRRK